MIDEQMTVRDVAGLHDLWASATMLAAPRDSRPAPTRTLLDSLGVGLEQALRHLGDELPYASAVDIEKFEMDGDLRRISAIIYVDRPGHKGIVIGEKGATLKRIGTEARHAMQELFGSRVHLELWVKVKSGWADNDAALRLLGYK